MPSKKAFLASAIALSLMGVGGTAFTSTESETLTARAEAGDPAALLDAGKALITGRGMAKDVDRGVLFLERVTQIGGKHAAFAHTALAQHYEQSADASPQAKAQMVRHYRHAAGLGDTVAQVKVAKILMETIASNSDPSYALQAQTQARALLEHANRHGNNEAAWELGFALYYGRGLERDTAEGEEWLKRAAHRGHVAASYLLASLYLDNPGSETYRPMAARGFLEIAANGGHHGALLKLSEGLETGNPWPRDLDKALEWSKKAKEVGAPNAGAIHERIVAAQTVARERARQAEQERLAAERAQAEREAKAAQAAIAAVQAAPISMGEPAPAVASAQPSMVPVSMPLAPSISPQPAVPQESALSLETVNASAPQSVQLAQLRTQVGQLTADNQRLRAQLSERDRRIASLTAERDSALQRVNMIQTRLDQLQSANQVYTAGATRPSARPAGTTNTAAARNAEGLAAYRKGDFRRAVRLWEQAAEAGSVEAMNNLGMVHLNGKLGATDVNVAMNHFRSAADRGHATAANNLGYIFEHGIGVGRDVTRARVWYARAAELGNQNARQNLSNLGTNVVAGL